MALMLKNDAVFLHIPKTGGKWVISVLKELDLIKFNFSHNHADMERTINFHRHFPMHFIRQTIKHGYYLNEVRTAFKFCFVRHPLKYYESYFKFASGLGWPPTMGKMPGSNEWHPNAPLYGCESNNFNDFVSKVVKKHPGYVSELYSWFVTPKIDYTGKSEHLADNLIEVLTIMGEKFDKDKVRNHDKINVSKIPKNIIIWDQQLKELVLKLEYSALVRYGYIDNQTKH